MSNTGVCPITSEELLKSALNALREKGALRVLSKEKCLREADALKEFLPDHYLPDLYLDLPLTDGTSGGMAAVLDCFDRCYLDYTSGGEYFRRIGVPALNAPENRDDLLVIRAGDMGAKYEVVSRKLTEVSRISEHDEELLALLPGLEALRHLPLRYRTEPCEGGFRLILTTGRADAKKRFVKKPYKAELLDFLSSAGCGEEALRALDNASFNLGIPYYRPQKGYLDWPVCLDVAVFVLTVRERKICDCHAVIRISDRCVNESDMALKFTQVYQWHITDNCDQRCKHCYLFAEDARLKCVSTPWEQLLLTLNEITADAERRGALPMPFITGGDPILHPDFWRFAEQLHRRGLHWQILGNPFHLDEAVCRRLYALGCQKYQMSMDGLMEFHDSMRKPGSYQATLDAVKVLNDAGIMTQFMATVSRLNLEDILKCMDVAVENHVTYFYFARYCATSPEKAAESYPTPEEYRDFLYRYYRKKKAYEAQGCKTKFALKEHLFTLVRYELGEFEPSAYAKAHPDQIIDGCHLGTNVTIASNGDLLACRRMDSVIGNVKTAHVRDILTSELCQSYIDIRNIKKCKDCELLQYCRGCRAVGFNATGDLQAADPCCWKNVTEA